MMAVVYNATIAALYRRHKETAAMKTNDPRPAHASSHDASAATAPAAPAASPASPAITPAAPASSIATAPAVKTEVGYTLQTLIVTAVFVLAAVGVGIGLLAINSSSSSDFEEAGRTGVERRCMPNEVWEPELEARGADGINPVYRGTTYKPDGGILAIYRADQEVVADNIGCKPICGTWEYYDPGRAAAGIGGPEGNGGVYSTAEGCFAPCYWGRPTGGHVTRPKVVQVDHSDSRLSYFDDNRAPIARQQRLGVNYRRSEDPTVPVPVTGNALRGLQQQQDLIVFNNNNQDGKPFLHARSKPHQTDGKGGSWRVAGTLPLSPAQLAAGFPTVFKPNWNSNGGDPGTARRNTDNLGNHEWEDENWEVRADPYKKVCTIVNTTLDDQVICSSEWDNCGGP